jgi:hypothetical protein
VKNQELIRRFFREKQEKNRGAAEFLPSRI